MGLVLFIFGLFVGSFLNVLVDRIQNKENPFTDRSHCDYCKKTLAWYDLVPLLSFISTRGKCRYCNHQLSFYYPITEFTTGILYATTYLVFPDRMISLIFGLFIVSIMVVVFFSDLKFGIIPDKVVLPAILIAFFYRFLYPDPLLADPIYTLFSFVTGNLFIFYLISGFVSFLLFFILFISTFGKAMGFGDVKFAFLLGLILGPFATIIALYIAFLTGGLVGLILILWKKKRMKSTIPFGPFLVLGFLISFFLYPQIIQVVLNYL